MSTVIPLLPCLTPATISEHEVTNARLSSLLDTAFIDHEIDDEGDVYITDGVDFPLWVHIESDRKLLVLFTYCAVDDQPAENWLARVNDMNEKIAVPQFAYRRDAVWGSHWITYDGGFNVRQLIKMLRIFGGAFRAGLQLRGRDTENPSELTTIQRRPS